MRIEILGTGCSKCQSLAANAEAAARSLGVPFELCKVTDLTEIMSRGVMFTPALVVDGTVRSAGKLLSAAEIQTILSNQTQGTPR